MKNLLYIFIISPILALGQTTSQNYVKTVVYRDASTTSDEAKAQVSVTYFDGLGQPIQNIAGKMSGSGTDMITHIEYDLFGRQSKEYLPYPASTSNLSFDGSAQINTVTYYNDPAFENTSNPYSEKFFELSPLGRVLKQGAPGTAWQGNAVNNTDRTVKFAYTLNLSNELKQYTAVATWNSTNKVYDIAFGLTQSTYYPINKVYKNIVQDENKTGNIYMGSTTSSKLNSTHEFKDQEGKLLLRRNFCRNAAGTAEALDTYYVYDQYGNLTYVLPPLMTSTSQIDDLGYQYKYDNRNRIVEKKLPGKQWEYIVYDNQDRVVATGPTPSPFGDLTEGWLVTAYDIFGRVAYTGWYQFSSFTSTTRKNLQNYTYEVAVRQAPLTIDNVQVSYSNVFQTNFSTAKLLTVNYYDNYTYTGAPTAPSSSTVVEGQPVLVNAKGLGTGKWSRILTTGNETYNEKDYTFYDKKSRPIRSRITNSQLGGYVEINDSLKFNGLSRYKITLHKRTSTDPQELSVREDFTYNNQDRIKNHRHKINNNITTELLSANFYNDIGQLITKQVGGYNDNVFQIPVQKVDYKYNIRGWLTDINDINALGTNDKFALKIAYNNISSSVTDPDVKALYNGNIAEVYWLSASDNTLRKYSFKYDNLDRLRNAYYQKAGIQTDSYNETLTYDKQGNIKTLVRTGGFDDLSYDIEIDQLEYIYEDTGNKSKLLKVTDSSTSPQGFKDGTNTANDYGYDLYGNMTSDLNKGITNITYNHLNLPVEITMTDTITKKINYIYNATGEKIKKIVIEGGFTLNVDYLSGFQYKNGELEFFPTDEGYVERTIVSGSPVYSYVYQYKDHLGNIRMDVAYARKKGEVAGVYIKEESHYYPFGMKHMNYNMDYQEFQEDEGGLILYPPLTETGKLPNNFMFQEQERQEELGLNWDSFKWRNYDYAIGRFMNIDPLAEKYLHNSIYAFSENKVIAHRELEGLEAVDVHDDIVRTFEEWGTSIKETATDVVDWFEDLGGTPEKSNEDVSVSLRSKNGGGNNPTTTGSADDHWNMDPFIQGAPGGEKKGNKYKKVKDFLTAGKDANSLASKTKKVKDKVVAETNKNEPKKDRKVVVITYKRDGKGGIKKAKTTESKPVTQDQAKKDSTKAAGTNKIVIILKS